MIYLAIVFIFLGLLFLLQALRANSESIKFVRRAPSKNPVIEKPPSKSQPEDNSVSLEQFSYHLEDIKNTNKERFSFEGVFYLDQDSGNRSLYKQGSFGTLHQYAGIQRIGSARLAIQGQTFYIYSDNMRYTYPDKELDQILFREGGIALIPKDSQQAVAIFLSRDTFSLKNYIKQYNAI